MLNGTYSVGRVIEESVCRSSSNYRFTAVGMYKIHATSLMPNIPFEAASEAPEHIDSTIFLNAGDTKLSFPTTVKCQNYLTTQYVGKVPYEAYGPYNTTPMGTQFMLKCFNCDPNAKYRAFGTESAIRGFNHAATD